MRYLAIVASMLTLVACNGGKNQTNIELIQDMMDQISVKSQDFDPSRPDGRANMVPPEGTVPRGFTPYKYAGKVLEAEANLVNPLAGEFSARTLELGKGRYEIYCKVCHGPTGHGDGPVAPKMIVRPKSLVTDQAKAYKDGRLYHIIMEGQGIMGSYAIQILDDKARWAVVNYMRTLQRNAKAQ